MLLDKPKLQKIQTITIIMLTLSLFNTPIIHPAAIAGGGAAAMEQEIMYPLVFATSTTIGGRQAMEDAHCNCMLSDNTIFFGIFDGHGGPHAADFCATHLPTHLINSNYFAREPHLAIINSFSTTHEAYFTSNGADQKQCPRDGTTAVIAFIKKEILYIGNVGDARAVLCTNNIALPLSFDHKPGEESERMRITKAYNNIHHRKNFLSSDDDTEIPIFTSERSIIPNFLERFGQIPEEKQVSVVRICSPKTTLRLTRGNAIAIARAIGDFAYAPLIIPEPFVSKTPLTHQEQFLILASDGLWDVMSNQAAVDIVLDHLERLRRENPTLFTHPEGLQQLAQLISGYLVNIASRELGSTDNITVTIILFPNALNLPNNLPLLRALQLSIQRHRETNNNNNTNDETHSDAESVVEEVLFIEPHQGTKATFRNP